MNSTLKLPVGIENFEEIRKSGFYYVDKTKLIEQLLQNWGKVNLFTRPRRFGKTLNMSMLRAFFETGVDPSLFEGLYISKNKEMCAEYMGKYPVIFLSFKGVDGLTFEEAQTRVTTIIRTEARRHYELKNSDRLVDEEIAQFAQLLAGKPDDLTDSIRLLSELLYRHFDQKVIIIIDEYDVPLDKAFQNGYYREMVALIRGLFGQTYVQRLLRLQQPDLADAGLQQGGRLGPVGLRDAVEHVQPRPGVAPDGAYERGGLDAAQAARARDYDALHIFYDIAAAKDNESLGHCSQGLPRDGGGIGYGDGLRAAGGVYQLAAEYLSISVKKLHKHPQKLIDIIQV